MQRRITRQQWQALLEALEAARRQRVLLTYRELIAQLQLPAPAMATLTAALEYLAALDARADQPLRSTLVVSQTGSGLPRPGFFACALQLGCLSAPLSEEQAAAWHAREVARVYDHVFSEVAR